MLQAVTRSRPAVPHLEFQQDGRLPSGFSAGCRVLVGGGLPSGAPDWPLVLEPGDILFAAEDRVENALCVLAPSGHGRCLLGRVSQGGLVAEPSGMPCSPKRWRITGRVVLQVRASSERPGLALRLPLGQERPGRVRHLALSLQRPLDPVPALGPDCELRWISATCVLVDLGQVPGCAMNRVERCLHDARMQGVRAKGVLSMSEGSALRALDWLAWGQVARVLPGAEGLVEEMPDSEQAAGQLALFPRSGESRGC